MNTKIEISSRRSSSMIRNTMAAALLLGAVALPVSQASAVSPGVKMACLGDYLSYCSSHQPDSPGVRKCMSANGLKLSARCVNALVAAGEVSKAEVARRAASR